MQPIWVDERCIHNFNGLVWKEEITWVVCAKLGVAP